MKIKTIIAAACTFAAVSNVFAGIITFENAPVNGKDLGAFYSGITFGFGEQNTTASTAFPATSGTHVLSGFNSSILFTFTAQQSTLSFFYSSLNGFSGIAYDKNGVQVDSFTGGPIINGTSKITLTEGSADISTVVLTDNGGGAAGMPELTTIDNLSAPGVNGLARPANAPEISSTLGLFAIAGLGLVAFRRKLAVQQ